jgi:RND family efflux transporter MFP subunit
MRTVATAERGDLEVKVVAEGNIEVPAVNLYFDTTMFTPPYSAQVKKVFVATGDFVKAGAILAKLDDVTQEMAVESAQYALELAINNVVQTVCLGINRAPVFRVNAVTLLRYESAMDDMKKALEYITDGTYEDAAAQISLAKYDLQAIIDYYQDSKYAELRPEFAGVDEALQYSKDVELAKKRVSKEIDSIIAIQERFRSGQQWGISDAINSLRLEMATTHIVMQRLNQLIGSYTCPDTCTVFTLVNEALGSLQILQDALASEDIDKLKFSQDLAIARHELELSRKVLNENVSTYRQGLNLKQERDYNINIQTAIINLERAKQALLKTELLAPFDGQVVDVNLKEGDTITQRYSAVGLPIDSYVIRLADVNSAKMVGTIGELDVGKVAKGQKAVVRVDALPGKEFHGEVKFISSFGTLQTGVASYKVEIALEPPEALCLTSGMSATAELSIASKKDVLLVPNSAVNGEHNEYWVWVMKDEADGVIEQRRVEIGLQSRTHTEIVSGLSQGERVLLGMVKPRNK